jgi:hypothetical protein
MDQVMYDQIVKGFEEALAEMPSKEGTRVLTAVLDCLNDPNRVWAQYAQGRVEVPANEAFKAHILNGFK